MRNLILLRKTALQITNSNKNPITNFLIDGNNRSTTYFLTNNGIYTTNNNNDSTNGENKLYEFNSSLAGSIIAAQHLSLNDEISLATIDGEIILLNLQSLNTESVAFCDGGISKMCWSPDQEVVVFLTTNNILVVMDSSYSIIGECELDDEQFGDGAFINVGWGRKETQFHGTEGKAAAKQKPLAESTINSEILNDSMENDELVKICWRGDSEYFVISFISKNLGADHCRLFKVYDKEGRLQFTSEKTIGLMAPICWRPNGPWICIPQILPNKYVVALFEKNGLKHREIILPFKAEEKFIVNMEWSSDSDVLAIETITKSNDKSSIYLFTMVNYHWYQKQTLKFDNKIISFEWDQRYSEGKQLHILLNNQQYLVYRYDYVVNHSRGFDQKSDEAIVAVIDGLKLLLTNFRGSVIPPPMAAYTLTTESPINNVEFINFHSNTNQFILVDTENMLSKYEAKFDNGILNNVELKYKYKIPTVENSSSNNITHLCWLTNDRFVISYESKTKIDESILVICSLSDNSIIINNQTIIDGQINRITATSNNQIYLLIFSLKNGLTVLDYQLNEKSSSSSSMSLQQPIEVLCKLTDQIAENILVHRSFSLYNTKIFLFKSKQWLMMNDKLLNDDATSIFLTEQYLLYTTLDKLKFVRLSDGLMVNERRVERGSRLVCVVPKSARTVLQMPRGNLEVIQPRVLSLCIIGDLLDDGEYYSVFELLRKQRINLNLIMDHNPQKFYNEIEQFINLVNNPNWLNLFLSDLINDDVTVTMYNSNYINELDTATNASASATATTTTTNSATKSSNIDVRFDFPNKINLVCEKVREIIEKNGKFDQLLLPILTSYCKQLNLEKALEIVWNIKQKEARNEDITEKITSADSALKYLLYLIDVNQLYNVALGMYDFGLVLFVATKSNKDPKEYIPFLNELKKETNLSYQHYRIDLYLKRYEKALDHIVNCGDEYIDEMLELVCQHELYTKAMKLYHHDIANIGYKRIVFQFAEHLREKGKFRDACLMYERSGHYEQAILSAKHILDADRCIQLAKKMNQTPEQIKHFVGSLIPALIENGNHLCAAELSIKYQSDCAQAVNILCNGRLYQKAVYEANLHNSNELIDTVIKDHLKTYAQQVILTIAEDLALYKKHKERLLQLRYEKVEEKKRNDNHDGIIDLVDDNIDILSDTSSFQSSTRGSSVSSRGTGKTHRSSKNRRKHERKLLNLKEGNPFEDIALIDALHGLVIKIVDQQASVRYLLRALIDHNFDEIGIEIQIKYKELLNVILTTLNEIWIPEMIVSGEIELGGGMDFIGDGGINQAGFVGGVIDYASIQEKRHYAMIKTHQRFKPTLKLIDWEFDVLC